MTSEVETAEAMSETEPAHTCVRCQGTGRIQVDGVSQHCPICALPRQQRRAIERSEEKRREALQRMADNAERVVVGEEEAARRERARRMLFALVKREGRVRIPIRELEAVGARDGLDVKLVGADLVITYLEGRARG